MNIDIVVMRPSNEPMTRNEAPPAAPSASGPKIEKVRSGSPAGTPSLGKEGPEQLLGVHVAAAATEALEPAHL